jgi:hypothetical protein
LWLILEKELFCKTKITFIAVKRSAMKLKNDCVACYHIYKKKLFFIFPQVVRGFAEKQIVFNPSKFVSKLEVDTPSTKIYRFHGAMAHQSGERVPVATESLLLRESRLKVSKFNRF